MRSGKSVMIPPSLEGVPVFEAARGSAPSAVTSTYKRSPANRVVKGPPRLLRREKRHEPQFPLGHLVRALAQGYDSDSWSARLASSARPSLPRRTRATRSSARSTVGACTAVARLTARSMWNGGVLRAGRASKKQTRSHRRLVAAPRRPTTRRTALGRSSRARHVVCSGRTRTRHPAADGRAQRGRADGAGASPYACELGLSIARERGGRSKTWGEGSPSSGTP